MGLYSPIAQGNIQSLMHFGLLIQVFHTCSSGTLLLSASIQKKQSRVLLSPAVSRVHVTPLLV